MTKIASFLSKAFENINRWFAWVENAVYFYQISLFVTMTFKFLISF